MPKGVKAIQVLSPARGFISQHFVVHDQEVFEGQEIMRICADGGFHKILAPAAGVWRWAVARNCVVGVYALLGRVICQVPVPPARRVPARIEVRITAQQRDEIEVLLQELSGVSRADLIRQLLSLGLDSYRVP